MNVINEIKTLLGMDLNLAQMKLMDGVTVLEADAFEMDNAIFIVNGEDKIEVEAQAETATPKRIVESVSKEMFFAEIEKLRTEIAELKLAKEVVKEELSSEVIVEPLTHSPEVKNEVKLNRISTNRQMTTQDIVMSKLFN